MPSEVDNSQTQFRSDMGLFLARFCPAAWIGAASLFVVVGVIEVTRGGFESVTKDQLVALRFPAFYWCGVILLGASWFGAWLARDSEFFPAKRRFVSLVLIAAVLGLMAIDYVFVFLPLVHMITPPGQAKPAGFASYHQASKTINLLELILCAAVAGLSNWPVKRHTSDSNDVVPRNQFGD